MQYQHALCLYPYLTDQNPGLGIFPPTGLEYIATALKGHVGRISLIDLRHAVHLRSPWAMRRFIHRDVDLVLVSIAWQQRYEQICRYISRLPCDVPIIVGGRQVSDQVEDVFQRCPNVRAVVRGEGEQTVQEIADGRAWDQIAGLSYRQDGRIVHNPNRPLVAIESIEPPDRSLRQARYVPVLQGRQLFTAEFDTILGSRGCPYHCTFCTFSLNPLGQKRDWVGRTPESVVDEIGACRGNVILFADDNFFVDVDRAQRICDLLIKRRIHKRYCVNCRLEVAQHPQVLAKAYRAGFRMLLLGIESPTDRILRQLGKGFTTAEVREAFAVFRQFPFFYLAYFIYGNVGETEHEMLAIGDYARELGVHALGLSRLRVDKYTPLRKLIENTPGYSISPKGHVYSKEFDKRRLRRIRNRIRNGFMWNPLQLGRTLSRLNACEILTWPQMVEIGAHAPLVLLEHLTRAGRKRIQRWGEEILGPPGV